MRPLVVSGPDRGKESHPAGELIRVHLEKILSSPSFAGAWRQQRLLRYLVEAVLQGRGRDLKEYCLGVEVFDKGEGFDPRLDPIVRVEASRLRARLKKYYEGEGRMDPIRFVLPRGSYVPGFEDSSEAEQRNGNGGSPEGAAASDSSERVPRTARPWIVTAVSLVALAAIGWLVGGKALDPGKGAAAGTAYDFSRITREQARCNFPSLSSDGRFLLYARNEAGNWDLFLRRLDDNEDLKNLTADSPADDRQPVFSPDGRRVAFRSERDGGGIFVTDIEGGNVRRVADFGYHPSWSPEGNRLVFSSDTFAEPEDGPARRASVLYVADLEAGTIQALTSPETVYDAVQPAWSPHGHRIAFWGSGPDGRRDLWTIPAAAAPSGSLRPAPVTQDGWLDWSPAWSPDGSYLYFSSDRDGAMNIWRVRIEELSGNVRGQPEAVRTPSTYSAHPSVGPGGNSFVYTRRTISSTLHSAAFQPDALIGLSSAKRLTAAGRQVREPEPSPDGAWLTARLQDPEEDIVLLKPDGTAMRRLTNDKFKDRNARWSPDGKQLLFLTNRSGTFEYWLMHADGGGLRRVAPSMALIWAPDGTLMGYPSDAPAYCLEPPGAPCVLANALPEGFVPMVWSPDGNRVAGRWRSSPPPREQLFVYSLRDRSAEQVTEHGFSPVWLKDGRALLYWENNKIWSWGTRSRRKRMVLDPGSNVLQQRFTLSAGQQSILFVLTEAEEDIWLARKRG